MRDQLLDDLRRLEAEDFAPVLREALLDGRCLLALDGLDEVPLALRGCVRQTVAAVLARYHPRRVIVTCRVRSYSGEALQPGFTAHTLAPFDEERIRRFASRLVHRAEDTGAGRTPIRPKHGETTWPARRSPPSCASFPPTR